jgi:phytoene dehydrogenase-like protein
VGTRGGKNVVIVGGGLAGLAASIYLARGGRTVTVFEKRQYLGGRAITHLRHGFRFNLGAHAVYRAGAAARVYRELGIPVPGHAPKQKGFAIFEGKEYRLPASFLSLLTTSLLSLGGKAQLAKALWRVRGIDPARVGSMTIKDWLDANFTDARARAVMAAVIRLATYTPHETQSAARGLAQLRVALRGGVLYVDEGWQRIVDSLRNTAVSSGVNFISGTRIMGVVRDHHGVRAVELGGLELDADRMDTLSVALPDTKPEDIEGALIPAETVLLAVDPETAAELAGFADFTKPWMASRPVTAACLDVGLRSLPRPKNTFALGIDEPLYYSVHSAYAQLAPKGGALIHLLKYRSEQTASDEVIDGERRRGAAQDDERLLEALLDRMQPGWRDVLVHRRFLPAMTVSNALTVPDLPRAQPVTPVPGLYVAGDWVGDEGVLSDAALSSARAAAKAMLSS